MRTWPALLLAASISWIPGAALAVEVLERHFDTDGDRYTLEVTFLVEVPPETLWSYLTDYDALNRYSESIRESRLVSRSDDQAEVASVVHSCVFVFCRTIRRHERVTEYYPERIDAEVDPEHSNLLSGATRWDLQPEAGGTRLTIHMHVEPDFWIPGFIGETRIQRATLRETTELLRYIERDYRSSR
ncbi:MULTISPECIES: SRPBCC family protein [unclassified Thioalkalivibrio]|uniref:SRPBCC family protein n=1 Tax=unclassified Thioalkalivibrio TaxID=2621013 RepID=UPI000368DC0B|nr:MULTISPECIES: SRPBCC family protein [unclassified Thioalkalivibrio]